MSYKHYSTEVSLYSGKTRAYLRHKGIAFEDVTSSIAVYREIIIPRIGRPIIPVVETPEGRLLQDTTPTIWHPHTQPGGNRLPDIFKRYR